MDTLSGPHFTDWAEILITQQADRICFQKTVSVLHDQRNPMTLLSRASTLAVNSVAQTSFSEIKSS